jgi:AraC-like DNA-binding protein
MKMSELYPSPVLRPWLSRYWTWQNEPYLPPLLPGTGAELFFWHPYQVGLSHSGAPDIHQVRSALLLPRDRVFRFHKISPPVSFIAIRFQTGALRHFCRYQEAELTDTIVHPADIWGPDVCRLEQQLAEAGSVPEQVSRIESFLTAQLNLYHKHQYPWVDKVARQMYYHHRTMTLNEMVAESGFSNRYFQQIFRQQFGVTPHHFRRIIRLKQLTRHLLLARQRDYLDSALAFGYYDQSHFIHDFRHFIGVTPSRFLQETNFSAHFYNYPSQG